MHLFFIGVCWFRFGCSAFYIKPMLVQTFSVYFIGLVQYPLLHIQIS